METSHLIYFLIAIIYQTFAFHTHQFTVVLTILIPCLFAISFLIFNFVFHPNFHLLKFSTFLLSFGDKTENLKNCFWNLKNQTKELETKERKKVIDWEDFSLSHQRPYAKSCLFFPSALMKSFRRTVPQSPERLIRSAQPLRLFLFSTFPLFFCHRRLEQVPTQMTNVERNGKSQKQ